MSDVHPDLEGIMENAQKIVEAECTSVLTNNFKDIEQNLFKIHGKPYMHQELWALRRVATNPDRTETFIVNNPEHPLTALDGESEGQLAIEMIGESDDILDGLTDRCASFALATDENNYGVMMRITTLATPPEWEGDPSLCPNTDKKDALLICFVTNISVALIARGFNPTGADTYYCATGDYEFGKRKYNYVDVLVNYFLGPKKLKRRNPLLFASLIEEFAQEDDE